MLRQHMLHAKHAKTGFGKLGERAASVQTRICVQRFEFQISMKCLGCFRRREGPNDVIEEDDEENR